MITKDRLQFRWLATITTMGAGLAFIGHGALATQKDLEWVSLFARALRFLPNGTPSYSTVENLTQYVGIADMLFGATLILFGLALCMRPSLSRATMRTISVLLGVAIFWQIMTSLAFIIADGALQPGVWHFLERSPSFLLPMVALFTLLWREKK